MSIQNKKKLAVLLPTYNAASYLKESIDSVLNQTFTDFDLYIYDDYSQDNTAELIGCYHDSRIFYIKNEKNIGVTKTLNKGLDYLLPHYEYVARMDADDWCYPERFEKQLQVLDKNEEVFLCGTQGYWLKDLNLSPNEGWSYPVSAEYIKYYLLFGATFGHSSVVLRSAAFIENELRYDETKVNCQDWELWSRVSKIGVMVNLADFLMKYRIVGNSNHRSPEKQQIHFENRSKIIASYWAVFGITFSEVEIYNLYYACETVSNQDFRTNVDKMIAAFNLVFEESKAELSVTDQKNFSYLLARKVLSYWKRSGVSRNDFVVWFFILRQVQFMNKMRLLKSIIR
ncbi:glycosyltransferase family 2 protein [Flavobacterium degerlachei]|jgi:glycosyltransferase involved in cell wall biosynthesis|uniref:Glycosyl transferase family 2 n=1 Tax=Flavobacterium degerlachei TaxID=229203 RepID=A0A1H2VVW8_9FLAO|nr:glycosyltransferase [Flavobacterium degerlachei]SDW72377.1 Glycosyl transferase family 2 [Flavobacterium degerlachei]